VAVRKPLLVVVAGPNGSGKSVVTEILRSSYDWSKGILEINPDKIAQEEFGDWNDPAAIKKAADRADEIREECLAAGKSLLFETVLSTPGKIDFIRRAKLAGYFVRMIFVATESPEINKLRIEWRVEQGGHSVPNEKIESRFVKSLNLSIEAARLADRAYFVDNTKDIEDGGEDSESPYTVFRTVDGKIAKTYVEERCIPLWCHSIRAALIA
jgi:predicted ABC-type ATPase